MPKLLLSLEIIRVEKPGMLKSLCAEYEMVEAALVPIAVLCSWRSCSLWEGFIDKQQTNKQNILAKSVYLLFTAKITKIERSLTNHEAKLPVAHRSSVCSILSRMSLIFHVNISESEYPVPLWDLTPRDLQLVIIHGCIELVQTKASRVSAISSGEQIFKSAFRAPLNGNTSSLMRNIDITAMGLLIN